MMNPWRQFRALLPESPLQVAEVTALNADGRTSTVEFPNGTETLARGQSVPVGQSAFIRDGEIRGVAPTIAPLTLDV